MVSVRKKQLCDVLKAKALARSQEDVNEGFEYLGGQYQDFWLLQGVKILLVYQKGNLTLEVQRK